MGPLGFEPRTDGLKVSGSSLKTAAKRTETARKHADLTPPSRYEWLQKLQLKSVENSGLRPKEHTCANVATVRALTATICAGAVNPNASLLLHEIDRSAPPAREVAMYVIGRCDAQLRASVEYLPESPLTQSQRRKEIKEGSHLLAVQQGVHEEL